MRKPITGRALRALSPPRRSARLALVAVLAGALFGAGCDVHGIADGGDLSSIAISPNPQILVAGTTQQFTAAGTDYVGQSVRFTPTWSVEAGGGTISTTGMFTAGTVAGTYTATVKATSGDGHSATATITVVPAALATIVVSPNPNTMVVGEAQQYVAVGKDASGNVV